MSVFDLLTVTFSESIHQPIIAFIPYIELPPHCKVIKLEYLNNPRKELNLLEGVFSTCSSWGYKIPLTPMMQVMQCQEANLLLKDLYVQHKHPSCVEAWCDMVTKSQSHLQDKMCIFLLGAFACSSCRAQLSHVNNITH